VSVFQLDDALIAELGWQQPRSAIQQVANPAVGGGFTEAMPGTFDTEVLACSFRLVTDGNAGSRNVVFQYLDQDAVAMFSVAAPYTQAASKTTDYTFAVDIQQFGANDAAHIGSPIPKLKLYVGLSVSVSITTVQVGDQVSRIRLGLARWPVRP